MSITCRLAVPRLSLPLLACLVLAGCAGTPQREGGAPVEERTGASVPQARPSPADTDSSVVQIQPLRRPAPPPSPSQPTLIDEPYDTGSGSAVSSLMASADQALGRGDLPVAVATVERALRIEPRNAALWHRLAKLRMDEGKARLAETLAVKSNSLAGDDHVLRSSNWDLIARAREIMGDEGGARDARNRAISFN